MFTQADYDKLVEFRQKVTKDFDEMLDHTKQAISTTEGTDWSGSSGSAFKTVESSIENAIITKRNEAVATIDNKLAVWKEELQRREAEEAQRAQSLQ